MICTEMYDFFRRRGRRRLMRILQIHTILQKIKSTVAMRIWSHSLPFRKERGVTDPKTEKKERKNSVHTVSVRKVINYRKTLGVQVQFDPFSRFSELNHMKEPVCGNVSASILVCLSNNQSNEFRRPGIMCTFQYGLLKCFLIPVNHE